MQVYLVKQLDADNTTNAFRNYGDIEPSLRISYQSCHNVVITARPKSTGGPVFTVKGTYPSDWGMPQDGKDFEHQFEVLRMAVWDSPTHI